MSEESIGGQMSSLFWASDVNVEFYAFAVTNYHCGKCGIALDQKKWPSTCRHGHRNVKR